MFNKTVFIKPNAKQKQYGAVQQLSAIEPPLWLALMANCYENPILIDMEVENLSKSDLTRQLEKINPSKIIILSTGSHPSAHIQQKQITKELVSYLSEYNIDTYDYLPFNPLSSGNPRWDLLPIDKYRAHNWHCWGGLKREPYGAIFSSISCPFKCEFCCVQDFYKSSYKTRTPSDVYSDLLALYRKYNVRNFKMMDELFVTNSKRIHDICDRFAEIGKDINIWSYARIDTVTEPLLKKLKKAGIRWLGYGIESGNDAIRLNTIKGGFNKDRIRDIIQMTKDAGIHIVGNYMFGFWADTFTTMQETLDFAIELNCEYANFYCLVAYPGSKLYEEMKNKGVELPKNSNEYAQMSPSFKPLPTLILFNHEVLQFRDNAFTRYFTNPDYLSMMRKTFGEETVKEIENMTEIKLDRELLQ